MCGRLLRWVKKNSKEMGSDIIRGFIANKIITLLSAIHFTIAWAFIENNYLILLAIVSNIFLWIAFYKKRKNFVQKSSNN